MARSLGLPAVVGVPGLLPTVRSGDMLIVDGSNGLVIVNPTAARLAGYGRRLTDMAKEVRALARLRDLPANKRDGQRSVEQTSGLPSLMRNSYSVSCLEKKEILKTDQ